MGFWDKLFGKGETDDQKLARARQAIDDNELTLAVSIVRDLQGASADEIRRRVREMSDARSNEPRKPESIAHGPDIDDPLHERGPYREPMGAPRSKKPRPQRKPGGTPPELRPTPRPAAPLEIHGMAADGSQRIGDVVLNAPVSDDDGRSRSTDGLDVATRLLEAVREQPLDPRGNAFIDSVLLFARAGRAVPRMRDPNRSALAALVAATASGEHDAVFDAIRAGFERGGGDAMVVFAPIVAAKAAPRALGLMAATRQVEVTELLVAALLPIDPELVGKMIEAYPDWAGHTLIAAEDAKVDVPGLAARWRDWKEIEDHALRVQWLALAVRREARRDLDAALALEAELENLEGSSFAATFAIASRLASHDRTRLRSILDAKDTHVDHAGWFLGAVRGGVSEIIDRWIDDFGPHVYDPCAYFDTVLEACIETRDLDRTRRLLAKAGPTGWQVACGAWRPLARAPSREMLDVLYERHPPSFVAGRAIARGAIPMHAGKVVIQPAWLDFRDPHPIETLALVVAPEAARYLWESPLAT